MLMHGLSVLLWNMSKQINDVTSCCMFGTVSSIHSHFACKRVKDQGPEE